MIFKETAGYCKSNKGSTRFPSVENSLLKRVWTCRRAECGKRAWVEIWRASMFLNCPAVNTSHSVYIWQYLSEADVKIPRNLYLFYWVTYRCEVSRKKIFLEICICFTEWRTAVRCHEKKNIEIDEQTQGRFISSHSHGLPVYSVYCTNWRHVVDLR
jgi:hypothetical protein